MIVVLLSALGVGGATFLGGICGFLFQSTAKRFSAAVMSFSAGVMLCASFVGLIIPATECGSILWCITGIYSGALVMDIGAQRLQKLRPTNNQVNKVILFIAAIALHNLPEGIAAGVSFGTENLTDATLIISGIALQNIPEGMVIIAPMLSIGISKKRTLLIAASTGLVEVIGTFLGYFTVIGSGALLPLALSFAAGTMLAIICTDMIPDCFTSRYAIYPMLIGFCSVLLVQSIL